MVLAYYFFALTINLLLPKCIAVDNFLDVKKSWDFGKLISSLTGEKIEYLEVAKPYVLKCGVLNGICLQGAACPWDRIIMDHSEWCTHHDKNLVCCHVARVRAPVNLFPAYD